jgi:hypothetical protein
MKCIFEITAVEYVLVCSVCGLEKFSKHGIDRTYRKCEGIKKEATQLSVASKKKCGCKKTI